MKNNQQGFSHVLLLVSVLLFVSVGGVGYGVYRKGQSQKATTQTNQANTVSQKQQANAEQKQEVTATETPQTPQPTVAPAPTPATPNKSTQRTISFTKGGGSQQGDKVVVSANLSETHAGTCTYEFYLNGTLRVGKSGATEGNKCYKEIPVSEFPKSATYSFKLTFISSDSSVVATQAPYDITVQ